MKPQTQQTGQLYSLYAYPWRLTPRLRLQVEQLFCHLDARDIPIDR